MESRLGDEALNRHSKRSRTQIPSTSVLLPLPPLLPELNTEILSRLPVKSLLQCRSVSKSWLAFISNPQFIKTHLSVSANNKDCTRHGLILRFYQHGKCILKDCSLRSLLYESVMEESDFNYPMKDQHKMFLVVGSINGLICLENGEKDLFLLNPSTRAYKKMPDFGSKFKIIHRSIYGFGYDECNDDYKVVGCMYRSPHVEVKIYSLKSDSWRSIHYPEEGVRLYGPGKLVNGRLHWADNVGAFLNKGWNIMSFNLADEKWEKVEHPRCGEEEDGILVLGVLENNLSVINKGNHPRTDLDVWVMKEYGVKESWTKMFTFKCPHSAMALLFQPPSLVSKKGEIFIMFGQNIFLCNLNDESITYREIKSGLVGAIYLESLVSPLLQNEEEHNRNEGCKSSDGRNCGVKDAVKKN